MELLRSFVTRHFAGKLVVSSQNVGCPGREEGRKGGRGGGGFSGYLIPREEENA